MKTRFTPHFLNYILNYYKSYGSDDFILRNFNLLKDQLLANTVNFVSNSSLEQINQTRFFDYYFLKDKQIIANESNLLYMHGINELKIRDISTKPKLLVSQIDNDYIPILNSVKSLYTNVNPSLLKIKLNQLFELNYNIPDKTLQYFMYVSRVYYDRNANIDFALQESAATLLLFEDLLSVVFTNLLGNCQDTILSNINNILVRQDNGEQIELKLRKSELIEFIDLPTTDFSNIVTDLLLKNLFSIRDISAKQEYRQIVYDTFIPQNITSIQLKSVYSSVKNLVDNDELIDEAIHSNIPNDRLLRVIDKFTDAESILTVGTIRGLFLSNGEAEKISQLFKDYLQVNINERFYNFIIYDFTKSLQQYLTAHFSSNDYGLISLQYIDQVDETEIYSYINSQLQIFSYIIKQLEYIATQFNKDPIQFFNCHYYIYDKFLQDFIGNLHLNLILNPDPTRENTLTISNIRNTILNLSIDDSVNPYQTKSKLTKLLELIQGVSDEWRFSSRDKTILDILNNTKIIENSFLKQYIEWINQFVSSELFMNYLLDEFIPNLISRSVQNNPLSKQLIIDNIESVRKFIKVALINECANNELFFDVTNDMKRIILYCFGQDFDEQYSGSLKNTNNDSFVFSFINKDMVLNAVESFKTITDIEIEEHQSKLFNFYVSSVVSDVLLSILSQYTI
jgi:hypothetical protein